MNTTTTNHTEETTTMPSTYEVKNAAGETVYTAGSDADAVRWWNENAAPGDYYQDTGESMRELADALDLPMD